MVVGTLLVDPHAVRRGVGKPIRTDWLVGLTSGPGTLFERGADKPSEEWNREAWIEA
jgi:hypothetical protein